MVRPDTASDNAPLARYQKKRDFRLTPEPAADVVSASPGPLGSLRFVVQKHWARQLHYDFRLELDGVMLSWAVPKGPCFDPAEKRMAIHVEDHPLSYGGFEGTIPARQYGAGKVMVWDHGTWEPVGEPRDGLAAGKLVFKLHGEKLAGLWELVCIAKAESRQNQWILFKKRDAWARSLADYDVIAALPDSVLEHPLGPLESREAPSRKPGNSTRESTPGPVPDLAAAVAAPLPRKLSPQLATLVSTPPTGDGWVVEPKFDGYRILARIDNDRARFITRGGHDWTAKMKSLATAVESLGIGSGWLDGEIVVLNDTGVPDFHALQNAIDNARSDLIVYFVFDAPFLGGQDLRMVALSSRRAVLKKLLDRPEPGRVRFSQDFGASPQQMLEAACQMNMEGIIVKRADARYVSARSDTWLKLKCSMRQEFVVCGFTDRAGSDNEVGALLLGYHEEGKLRYAGNVGTGWDARTGRDMHARLVELVAEVPPIDPATVGPGRWSRRSGGVQRWVKPVLLAEVAFTAWTPDGRLRHPSFKGLRSDKMAAEVAREVAADAGAAPAPSRSGNRSTARNAAGGVKVSNPERVIDPSTGLRKLDLVRYYETIADWILPHLKDRPVSLVRAPDGIAGELFFQKHPESRMPGLRTLDPALWPGHGALLAIDDAKALVQAAQMNMVELHTWNSRASRIDKPDRIVFDLDPGEGVGWRELQEAAQLTRALLEELGLESWLKTSGGTGLHLVVPLAPRLEYGIVKDFSQEAVRHLARTIPSRFVSRSGPSNRVGRIFVDYLRNGHGQTTAAAYSARARPGMGVSMPVDWEQLMSLKSASDWTIRTAREYLSFQKRDPWEGFWKSRQQLIRALRILG
ncbi:MAG: DNA ligase D [Lautropia sp.]